MTEPRLIMFDMDGTLIDSGAIIAENMAATFRDHGMVEPTPYMTHTIIGLSLELAIETLAQCKAETAILMAGTYRKRYRAMLATGDHHEPLYAGALDALDRLHSHEASVLGIATGKGLNGVHRILALHDLTDRFVTLQTPDDNPSKPHPGMIHRACSQTGIDPRATVMIGDTSFDMQLGRSAGARTVGVTWGYHSRVALEEAGAHIIIDNFSDLDMAIEEVLN